MARSNYKRFYLSYEDLIYHYNTVVLENHSYIPESDRSKTINVLTQNARFTLDGGKHILSNFRSSEYCIGKKLGMFSKTRKPFFFRSKIKKKKNES